MKPKSVKAARGLKLTCKGWHQEAAMRMLNNNLDAEVAENPKELIVYGGTGKAARNWECYAAIIKSLKSLKNDETLLVQSGKPVGIFQTHEHSPRVIIANSHLVPHWATWEKFRQLDRLGLIMFGGAIVKPVISGTVAKCSDEKHRARAFSIFYMVVNIGAFYGKTVADPLRERFGLEYINFYASAMAFIALVCVTFFYRDVDREPTSKTLREAWKGLVKVLRHFRFLALILIVAGFWVIQGQLYASMVKYYLRLVGEGKPAWLANINPLVVIILVVPITHLVRHFKPENSIAIGLLIIPLTAVAIALGPVFGPDVGSTVELGLGITMHPITLMLIIGIGLQGLAECFLSPKWLEYASRQAPKGEEGLYLGYQHLTTFFAWLFGFGISGYLLAWWCPDPKTLSEVEQAQYAAAMESGGRLPEAYAHAHYIWYFFAGVGVVAFAAMLVFKFVTNAIDRRRDAASGTAS